MAVIRQQDLEEACRRHIEGMHSTLFGRFFNVKGGEAELGEASGWLAGQVAAVIGNFGINVQPPEDSA